MDALLITARLCLADVFIVAAWTKYRGLTAFQSGLADFGISPFLAKLIAIVLPLAELLTAAGLLMVATAWWAALIAVTLIGGFAAVVGINLSLNRRPACNCFGQQSSSPIGWRTLALQFAMGSLAAFIAWQSLRTRDSSAA